MEWKFGVQKCVFLSAPVLRPQESELNVALSPIVNSFGVYKCLIALIAVSKNDHKPCLTMIGATNPNMCLLGQIRMLRLQ